MALKESLIIELICASLAAQGKWTEQLEQFKNKKIYLFNFTKQNKK